MKNVLFIRSGLINSDSRVLKEVSTLIKAGYNVEVLSWDRYSNTPLKTETLVYSNIEIIIHKIGIVHKFGASFWKKIPALLKFQRKIANFIKTNKSRFDIIHACDFDTGHTSFKYSKKFKIKFVYDIFDYYIADLRVPANLRNIIEKKELNIINRATAVIICSEQRLEQVGKAKRKDYTIIHNSPPLIPNLSPIVLTSNKIKIGYVGTLMKHRYLVEIVNFVTNNKEFELHIGGGGTLAPYFENISSTNENVIYYGRMDYEKGLSMVSGCDIMIAIYDPSISNNFYAAPNKFYESLMLGKPIIMARNTGFSSIIEENKFGLVIDYNKEINKDDLLLSIANFNKNELSKQMKILYTKNYSWEIMGNRLIELYSNL